ncbi:hypothetical protein Aspvir_007925 [Aspergillus viridinutans]|uniref:Uncharacterized protein n=1 Tax=Aspergillus viridinutans TaxID=75553 RepID=A0A9P3F6W4_ASPVI|nr:uncharacterized protein Aspvir_007925 [Aspergillus viridinutans]GIK03850.1 hypothetical protein Aspvir_007925 [Aspergillus viridinutans]
MSTDWTNDPQAAHKALQKSLEDQFEKFPDRFLKEGKSDGKKTFNGDKSPFYGANTNPRWNHYISNVRADPRIPLAIQAYVWCGMLYPDSDAEFRKKLPESRFEPLEKVVPKIYEDTKDALVSVSDSCHRFSKGPMEPVFSYSSLVKKYATNAKTSLGAEDGLGAQLKTLTSDKYKGRDSIDKDFEAAKELAKERLEELRAEAKEKETQSDTLRQQLQDFLNETEGNKTRITSLHEKYLSPVTDSSGKQYSNAMVYLNRELADLQKKLKDARDEADKTSKELKDRGDPKGWKFWATFFGGAGAGVDLYLKLQDFKDASNKWATKNAETAAVQHCQTTVTALKDQIDELVIRMAKAVEGIRTIQDTFRHLGESLDPVIKAIDKIEKGTSSPLAAIRKSNINHGIRDAVTKYDEIIREAEEFAKAVRIKVTDA